MPQLIIEALIYFGASATVATVAGYAIFIAAAYSYGTYQSSQARKKANSAFNASLKDRLEMVALTDAPRSRVYGRVRNVDGILFKASHGDKLQFYTFVVAVAGHEIDGFEDFWFADQKLAVDGDGYVSTEPYGASKYDSGTELLVASQPTGTMAVPAGIVTNSIAVVQLLDGASTLLPFTLSGGNLTWTGGTDGGFITVSYQVHSQPSFARVRGFTGGPGQDLSGELTALGISGITGAHRFNGIAVMLVTLTYSSDAFPQGVPQMSATIRGARVFDPRNPIAGLQWTENPALIARDWATYAYGGNVAPAEIDDGILIASANACDMGHTFVMAATGTFPSLSYTRPIYTCGIVAPTQTDPTATLQEIVQSMAGKYTWAGGRLRIRAGFYSAPVATIDETWINSAESIAVTSGMPRIDLVNVYRPTISDAENGYVVVPTPAVRADAYVESDGQELPRDITLAAVTDSWHAQHVCGVMLRDMRQGLTLKLPCNLRAYPLEMFDVVAVSLARYGWVDKTFEVLGWEFSPTGGVVLSLKETNALIYDPDAGFSAADEAPNTNMPLPWYVPPPTGLSITSGTTALEDGSIITRTRVEWDLYPLESVRESGQIEIQYVRAHEMPPEPIDWPAVREGGGAYSTVIVGLQQRWVYIFRIRAINAIGVRSRWSVATAHEISAAPLIPGGSYQQEEAPANPGEGALWEVPSTGNIYRWNEALESWILFGSPGGTTPIDLTPPPTVTGLHATAGFANILVEWNVPTYTQGGGNKKTNIYAVQLPAGSSIAPTFESASLVASGAGPITIIAIPTDLGVRWHLWARFETINGIQSVVPAGGANGVVAQTGMIDGTDLAPLIIEARHLRAASSSIFPDEGFEAGTAAWPGLVSRTGDATAPSGFAAHFTGRDNPSFAIPIVVAPNEQYQASLWLNRAGDLQTAGIAAGIIYYVLNSAGTVIASNVASTSANGWQRVEINLTIPVGGTALLVGPWISQAFDGTLVGHFDRIRVERRITAGLVTTNMIVAGAGAIGALAIENAMIANTTIDDAKIARVSAAKLTVGDGTVGGQLRSTNHVPFSAGWVLLPNGNAEFSSVYMRGEVHALSGDIGGIKIASGYVESNNFNFAAGLGFSLNSDGTIYAFNGHFGGTLHAANGQFSGDISGSNGTFNGTLSTNALTVAGFSIFSPVHAVSATPVTPPQSNFSIPSSVVWSTLNVLTPTVNPGSTGDVVIIINVDYIAGNLSSGDAGGGGDA